MARSALFRSILLCCLLKYATCWRIPTITHITQEQVKDIGGTVELECSIQNPQEDYPVLWLKSDKSDKSKLSPLSHESTLITKDSRFALRYDITSSTYTLQIKDIQETDSGWYVCAILITVRQKITAEVELHVRRPPFFSDNSTRFLVANEDRSAQMECYAGGFPPPNISWRRENNAILPTGGFIYRGHVLRIPTVRKEDRGTYYCVAENGVGNGTRMDISLEVEFAPVVTIPPPRLGQNFTQNNDSQEFQNMDLENEFSLDSQNTSSINPRPVHPSQTENESSLDSQGSTSSTPPPGLLQTGQTQKRPCFTQRAEEVLNLIENKLSKLEIKTEDEFDIIGKNVANKFRKLPEQMRMITEKFINDMLFQAQMGNLTLQSTICTPRPHTENAVDFLNSFNRYL